MNGASGANFLVELDGVAILQASEVNGLSKKMEPFEINTGDTSMPKYGRGKSKVDAVTVKHAFALNTAGREVMRWFDDFTLGLAVEKRNLRVVQLAEDGFGVQGTYDLIDCLPIEFTPDDHKADGKDAAYFMFKVQPHDMIVVTDG